MFSLFSDQPREWLKYRFLKILPKTIHLPMSYKGVTQPKLSKEPKLATKN
jgi:hypothetical protein